MRGRPMWSPPQEGSGPASLWRGPGVPSLWGMCQETHSFLLLACVGSRHLGHSGSQAPPGAHVPGLSGGSRLMSHRHASSDPSHLPK